MAEETGIWVKPAQPEGCTTEDTEDTEPGPEWEGFGSGSGNPSPSVSVFSVSSVVKHLRIALLSNRSGLWEHHLKHAPAASETLPFLPPVLRSSLFTLPVRLPKDLGNDEKTN